MPEETADLARQSASYVAVYDAVGSNKNDVDWNGRVFTYRDGDDDPRKKQCALYRI